MKDTFYTYISDNNLFLKRKYRVLNAFEIQRVQQSPSVFLIFSTENKAFVSRFTLTVLKQIEQGFSIEEIMKNYPFSETLLDSIAKSIAILTRNLFIEVDYEK